MAINVGGALIPVILSIYLMFRNRLFIRGILGVTVIALVTHHLAQPVRGVGITLPGLVPAILAALVAVVLGRRQAPPLAYISGSLGTLIGADLMNLDRIQGLGAPVASIGGAGKFDGVFLSGILAVPLSPVAGPPKPQETVGQSGI